MIAHVSSLPASRPTPPHRLASRARAPQEADPIVQVFQRGCSAAICGAAGAVDGAVHGLIGGALGQLKRRTPAQREAANHARIANVVAGAVVGAVMAGPLGCVGGAVAGVYSRVGIVGAGLEGGRLALRAAREGWRKGNLDAAGRHLQWMGDDIAEIGVHREGYNAFARDIQQLFV
ncbi:MAG: hypothetical protein EB084_14575 [Proteobacteria bacterium]|nr:hypothetical protein [Pseudomonadota bacterium]